MLNTLCVLTQYYLYYIYYIIFIVFQACHERRMSKYPAQVRKALEGVPYVAKHMKDTDDTIKVRRFSIFMVSLVNRIKVINRKPA